VRSLKSLNSFCHFVFSGGYMAKQMGVPLGYLCAGVNINDITNTVFQTGVIQKTDEPMQETLSEAINIQLPYNLERLLFYLTDGNHQQVREWYTSLDSSRRVDLNTEWLTKLQSEFRSARVTDGELCSTLKETLKKYMYLADPHTGVAFAAAKQFGYLEKSSQSTVCLLATASPSKFQKSMTVALGSSTWEDYEQNSFPERGKETLKKPEKPPFVYKAVPGDTLEVNQVRWEQMSRKLIEAL
jgi:threonine synthase